MYTVKTEISSIRQTSTLSRKKQGRAGAVLLLLACINPPRALCADRERAVASPEHLLHAETKAEVAATLGCNSQGVSKLFLNVETSKWLAMRFVRDGQQIGPKFFSIIPDGVVTGSRGAEDHLTRARVYHGLALGLPVLGLGLIAGGLVDLSSSSQRNTSSRVLVFSGVVSVFLSSLFSSFRANELLAAITTYNSDLVSGQLGKGP